MPMKSSGSPSRRSGVCSFTRCAASGLSHSAFAKSVFTSPGQIAFTRTPAGPCSSARLRTSAMSASLEMLYAPSVADGPNAPVDEVIMIEPRPFAFMSGITMLQIHRLAFTFTAMILSKASSGMSIDEP